MTNIIITDNKQTPNAIYLGRIIGNGAIQCMWQVYNPEVAHEALQKVIKSDPDVAFKCEMDRDKEWKNAHYWLDPLNK